MREIVKGERELRERQEQGAEVVQIPEGARRGIERGGGAM